MTLLFIPHAAVSVPKKKRKLKDLNKKETGDVLDAFKEVCVSVHVFSRGLVHIF